MMDDNSNKLDKSLISAYLNTDYYINLKQINLKVGVFSKELIEWLESLRENFAPISFAIITAFNPFSELLSLSDNEKRNKRLVYYLKENKYQFFHAENRDPKNEWPIEKSFLVPFISKQEAMEIAQQFQQNAIVYGIANTPPELVFVVRPG